MSLVYGVGEFSSYETDTSRTWRDLKCVRAADEAVIVHELPLARHQDRSFTINNMGDAGCSCTITASSATLG
jgi:hypothetical protein